MRRIVSFFILSAWASGHGLATLWRRWIRRSEAPPMPLSSSAPEGERSPRPRILVVCPYSVHPMNHGGAVRVGNLVRRLAEPFDVHLFLFSGGTDEPEQRAALDPFCRRIYVERVAPDDGADPWQLRPPRAAGFFSRATADRLRAIVAAEAIDVVDLEFTEMADFRGPYPDARVVLTEIDLHFRTFSRQKALGFDRRYHRRFGYGRGLGDWLRALHAEIRGCREVDQVHTMSTDDAAVLATHLPDGWARLRVVPNGVDTAWYTPQPPVARDGLLFVGSFPHLPNVDALEFFVDTVWPRLRAEHPDLGLTVAGTGAPTSVLGLDGKDGVRVVGEVPDLRPLYRSHAVLVVPIRAGSGTRLKILEALASGLPVVSTRIGAEGLDAEPGLDLLLADEPAEIASAVSSLLGDPARAAGLAERGRALACRTYSWDVIARRQGEALSSLIADPPRHVGSPRPRSTTSLGPAPAVSVLVLTGTVDAQVEDCLAGIACQVEVGPVEVVVADRTVEGASAPAGVVVVRMPRMAEGAALDEAAAASRAPVLVVIRSDATPIGPRWLEQLTAPFASAVAPSVTVGGVHERFFAGSPRHRLRALAADRQWMSGHDDLDLDWTNMAVRRDVWEDQPFGPVRGAGDRRWQRRMVQAGRLVLPCWSAEVVHTQGTSLRRLFERGLDAGAALGPLGLRYSLGALIGDLWQAPVFAGQGRRWLWTRPVSSRAERALPWLWPVAVFLGRLGFVVGLRR